MAEVLVQFADPVVDENGTVYVARACGGPMPDGLWQGWIEFLTAEAQALRSGRETTQPNREDTVYWATGLTPVYLEGALRRARRGPVARPAAPSIVPPVFDGPAEDLGAPPAAESVLNPFSVYRKGEALLRRQLGALSAWHLVNIVVAHELSDARPEVLNSLDDATLIEMIVSGVRERTAPAAR